VPFSTLRVKEKNMQTDQAILPAGLCFHCAECRIVIPSDAPLIEGADCAFVALHRLAWFNPNETPAGQHCQAAAAWELIHDAPLKAGHAGAVAYRHRFKRERKAHFAESAVRQAMTPEQIEEALLGQRPEHARDRSLFVDKGAK
jgi:hypothetical protein